MTSALSLTMATTVYAQVERATIDFEFVSQRAAELIESKPRKDVEELSKALRELDYDGYRNIRFRPSEALWWTDPYKFRVEFFHLGHIFTDPVEIFEFTDSHVQKIPFRDDAYNYSQSSYKPRFFNAPNNHAGIRVKYPLNENDVYDDLIVFLGASYFRALGPDQVYGLSLRGISMNITGDEESFPRFTKLWLKKPAEDDQTLLIYALLEGDKITGAYQFTLHCNSILKIDVRSQLYFRGDGAQEVGLAPMTSMFVFGENSRNKYNDWRPEVHDSDGVLIQSTENEWLWHPLDNIQGRHTKTFKVDPVTGFGLMQRDRDFTHYKDLEANYQDRPSAWITPKGQWPDGQVVLYTFKTETEITDNVNVFWKPDFEVGTGGPIDIEYTITLLKVGPEHALGRVLETRVGQRTLDSNSSTIMIEFSRPEAVNIQEIALLEKNVELSGLKTINDPVIEYNRAENRIRLTLNIETPARSPGGEPLELSAKLLKDGQPITERWSYSWSP